ncbi:uncharacterized protein LOC128347882 [Hemicordylus capensis]|uniref:uncharacterized protein LOC128347882 n=1 Tax=Hemicordylus capensis TaxID=884348 RepID=UPI00230232C3|nr:uncharacterized protein LOC128347882 [Hemicordylus capensis]
MIRVRQLVYQPRTKEISMGYLVLNLRGEVIQTSLDPVCPVPPEKILESSDSSCNSDPDSNTSSSGEDTVAPRRDPQGNGVEPLSLSGKYKTFLAYVSKMAGALGIQLHEVAKPSTNPLFDVLEEGSPQVVALPMNQALLDIVQSFGGKPSSVQAVSRKVDNLYRIRTEDTMFLHKHPALNSIVVEVAQTKSKNKLLFTAVDREGLQLDAIGKRVYYTSVMQMKIANYQACMSRYNLLLWEKLTEHLGSLQETQREVILSFQKEGYKRSKQLLHTSKHTTDSAANNIRQLAQHIYGQVCHPARDVQRMLGLMASTTATLLTARLHMRLLQRWFLDAFWVSRDHNSKVLRIPAQVRSTLTWWMNIRNLEQSTPFQRTPPQVLVTTPQRMFWVRIFKIFA